MEIYSLTEDRKQSMFVHWLVSKVGNVGNGTLKLGMQPTEINGNFRILKWRRYCTN